jgi:hypothetical protein
MAKVKNPPTPFELFLARNLLAALTCPSDSRKRFSRSACDDIVPVGVASTISRRMLRQKGDLKMDNEKQSGQQSGQQNPSQKDPQKERDNQQQRQGETQQDPQRRPGQSEQDQDRDKDQQKDRKSA